MKTAGYKRHGRQWEGEELAQREDALGSARHTWNSRISSDRASSTRSSEADDRYQHNPTTMPTRIAAPDSVIHQMWYLSAAP